MRLRRSGNAVNPHVWTQNFGDQDRAICLLIIFDDSDPGAADGEAGAVERVNKVALAAAFWLIADTGAPRLEGFAVRAGRDLSKFVARRQPDFDVVGFCRSKAHVAGAEQHGAIVQAELLKNGFCISYQRFVLFVAFLRMGELEELNLLELMLAEDPAGVFSGGAGFGAEAGGPCGDVDGEFIFGNRFVPIQIVKFYFRSRCKPEIGVLYFEEIGGELRQLARAGERRSVYQKGWKNFCVTVFARVNVEEEIRQGTLQASSPAFVNGEARAGNLRGGGKIEDACAFSDIPVRLWREIKFRRRTPAANFDIVSRARADRHGGVRNVGNG